MKAQTLFCVIALCSETLTACGAADSPDPTLNLYAAKGEEAEGDQPDPPSDQDPVPPENPMRNTDTTGSGSETAADAAADAEAAAEAEAADMDAYVVRDARCAFGQPDPDRDGLCTPLELQYGTDPNNRDTDGDGLSDGMEVKGYRVRRTRERIILPDANPLRYDIYVEIDYTPGFRPSNEAIEDVKRAFANASTVNYDKSKGVALHVEIDDVNPIKQVYSNIQFPEEYTTIKNLNFDPRRSPAYHYALFSAQYNNSGSSGVAIGGVDLMVTLGGEGFLNDRSEQAGTFMHELGHNLGLPHGGLKLDQSPDLTNFKPNYLSIMSYTYQFIGVPRADGSMALDYSRASVGELREAALSEAAGLGVSGSDLGALAQYDAPLICLQQVRTPAFEDCNQFARLPGTVPTANLDFNLNFCIDPQTIAADLNGFNGTADTFPTVLDDWTHLKYDGNGVIGDLRRIDARVRSVEAPITCARANTLRAVSRVPADSPVPPMCNPAGL